jgi:hypothetical protein
MIPVKIASPRTFNFAFGIAVPIPIFKFSSPTNQYSDCPVVFRPMANCLSLSG